MTARTSTTAQHANTTDNLNRATLRISFNTLRKTSPSCALLIQNVLMQQHHLAQKSDSDVFTILLSDDQIEQIIESLLALCLINSHEQYPSNNMHTLRGLLNQWTKVANHRKLL